MPKRATKVVLSEKEQEALTRISRRYRSEQQVAQRARIILAAAQGQSNAHIARELAINVDTAPVARSLGRLAGDRPRYAKHHRALARRPATGEEARDHDGATLPDGGVGL